MNEIPKIIHYCWFGGNPLPKSAIKCIESWKKYLPDYEIKQWNEDNFDVKSCRFVKEAYEAKNWAFVSDYARIKILYENGGLYFDTDVEVIKSFDDIVDKGPFMGFESDLWVAPGLGLGAIKGMELYKKTIDLYETISFYDNDGKPMNMTICNYITNILAENGLERNGTKNIQYLNGVYIYPKDYFCPLDYSTGKLHITQNTRSIHQYASSWKTNREKLQHKIIQIIGKENTTKIVRIINKIKKKI